MPRTREQFAEMKDERKQAIFAAALPLFSVSEKVSIDAICEKAKCSHGIVYHYFKNVEQIREKLMNSSTFVEIKHNIFDNLEGSSYEKIEHIIGEMLDVSQKNIEKVCYLNILIKNTEKDSIFSLLTNLIKTAQQASTIKGGDPAEIVNTLFLLFKGIYLSLILEKHPTSKVPSLETVMQLIRKPNSFYHQTL